MLGEIPDPEAALGELRRVLKPAGRLVVGEIFIDPDFPRLAWLVRRARAAGVSGPFTSQSTMSADVAGRIAGGSQAEPLVTFGHVAGLPDGNYAGLNLAK